MGALSTPAVALAEACVATISCNPRIVSGWGHATMVASALAIGDYRAMAVTYPTERVTPAVPPLEGSRGWRRLVVGGAPILAVVAVMVIAGVIASYVYDTNRRGAVTLSNDLIDAIDQRIALQMGAYLAPAEQFLELARAIGGERGVFDGALATEPFVLATLGKHPQVAGFSYGDPDGNFLYVARNEQGGFDTKLVDRRGGGHRVTWTRRNEEGEAVGDDRRIPATPSIRAPGRGIIGAMNEGRPFWTTPYVFFTLKRPGITLRPAAIRRRPAAGRGAWHRHRALRAQHVPQEPRDRPARQGAGGRRQGAGDRLPVRQLATPIPRRAPSLPQLDELGDPMLTRIYNRLKVEGFGRKLLDIGNQRIIVSSGALKALTGRNWSVLIVAPEADFLGFVASSGRLALALSVVVFLLMAALAVLMMWRSLQADRRDRAAGERHRALEARAQTLCRSRRHART